MNKRNTDPLLPPTSIVLLSIGSTQLGSAIAKSLIKELNPIAVLFLRLGFAAIVLLILWRNQIKGNIRSNYRCLILFSLSLALMNLSFYAAIDRIPLGIAVTIEFVGPLSIAIANSRQFLDLVWVLLAAVGIVLLAPTGGLLLDPIGIGLALLAGTFWSAYIFLSARVGKALPGGAGLALAMGLAAVVLLPGGVVAGGSAFLNPKLLLVGFGVAMLSSAIPYSLEMEALRFLPTRVFSVLLSLEPVAAALMGFLVLKETLTLRAIVAILLVTIAAVGVSKKSN
ncbi:EamA family transporter [Aetokthonos hydrillicola Thurmond2011]|jgi:inner membrane transporter RhtA|uniref:EamA family transporter n=2 Tax=Aetokthonos TaxID=1550243 RepID=A0AAP5I4J7_9CYAN|nr:EamA family transporter [Aetokthonos hydrillicola]MBO3457683.1 EamA family transporter [Aetokthonos hydrillicola CCALA 1050]MBW4587962.1 EamA family transporter [Aetokthonos hydrillicola CCALA 1050]MDR9894631.1 EamA family transporter [Aetokthonos hydrillicola Thurmond2011]